MQNMKKFYNGSKFAKSITSLLVGLTADKNDLQILKAAFTEIDSDGDGIISFDEFERYQGELGAFGLGDKWQQMVLKSNI